MCQGLIWSHPQAVPRRKPQRWMWVKRTIFSPCSSCICFIVCSYGVVSVLIFLLIPIYGNHSCRLLSICVVMLSNWVPLIGTICERLFFLPMIFENIDSFCKLWVGCLVDFSWKYFGVAVLSLMFMYRNYSPFCGWTSHGNEWRIRARETDLVKIWNYP